MKNSVCFLLVPLIIISSGCIFTDEKSPEDTNGEDILTVSELKNDASDFLNKTVNVSGEIQRSNVNTYYITDQNNKIGVQPWIPLNVAQCPPNVDNCQSPEQMSTYLGRNLNITGTLKREKVKETSWEYLLVNISIRDS